MGELEGLLAIARADQYKRDAAAAEAAPERAATALREQKRLLEEQVATLQRQVDGLVQVGTPPLPAVGSLAGTRLWHEHHPCTQYRACWQHAMTGSHCDGG